MRKVLVYGLSWNPNVKSGTIVVRLEDGTQSEVPVGSAGEFAVVSAILKESPVWVHQNGSLTTEWEPTG